MKKLSLLFAACLLCASTVAHADDISISVTPWLAPNGYGSPSWGAAQQNAVTAEEQGLSTYGAPGPTQFNAQTAPITGGQAIVTDFNSWMGVADPTGAYAGEYGNRMTFAVAITSDDGALFSISDLSFSATSTDVLNPADPIDEPGDALGFSYDAGSYDYSDAYVGVIDNPDGSFTFVTGGPSTQLVNAIYARGSGNSLAAYCTPCTTAQEQAAIYQAASLNGTPYTFTGTYSLDGASGSGTFDIIPTPEPSSLVLLGTGALGALGAIRRRFRAV